MFEARTAFLIGKSHCPLTQGDVLQEAIGKHQHTPTSSSFMFLADFCWVNEATANPTAPKKMESNNKKR